MLSSCVFIYVPLAASGRCMRTLGNVRLPAIVANFRRIAYSMSFVHLMRCIACCKPIANIACASEFLVSAALILLYNEFVNSAF